MPKLTVEKIYDYLDQCEKVRRKFITKAKHCWGLVYDQQRRDPITGEALSSTHPDVQENHIRSKVLDARSVLLKNDPTFIVRATKPTDIDLAGDVTRMAFKKWRRTDARTAIGMSQLEALFAGLSILRNSRPNGRERWLNVPGEDFWHDPRLLNIGDGWCCYRTWQTEEGLNRHFDKVSAVLGKQGVMKANVEQKDLSGLSPQTPPQEGQPPEEWGKDLWALYEFWAPVGMAENDDWEVYFVVNDKILDIRENPCSEVRNMMQQDGSVIERKLGHGRPPFVVHRCYLKQRRDGYLGFYDVEGIVESLEWVQWCLSEAARALVILTQRAAEPVTQMAEEAMVEPGQVFTWGPGEVQVYRTGHNPPQAVSVGLESTQPAYSHEHYIKMMGEMSGVRPGMVGQWPQGSSHTPAGTVMFGQEAAFVRMPDIVEELDKTILNMGDIILGNLQQHEQPGTWIDVSMAGEQRAIEWTEKHIETEFDLDIISGTTTILRDIDRQQNATNLYQGVVAVLANPTVQTLKATKQWLLMLDEPSGYGYLTLIDDEIERLQMMETMAMQMQPQPSAEGMMRPAEGLPPTAEGLPPTMEI